MRLIDADALIEKLSTFNDRVHGDTHFICGIESAKEIIQNEPTVDAEPVRHGKWEYGEDESGYDGYYCSKCFGHVRWYGKAGKQSINFIKKYNYCPNCGADMRGEKDG